jgi:hypothetical protein
MKVRLTFVACLGSLLGGAPQLRAQFVQYIAHVADGAGWFSELAVNNPGGSAVACTFSTFDDNGGPLGLSYSSPDPGPAPSARAHTRAKAATSFAVDSVSLGIPAGGTSILDTSGFGDGSANPLEGSAQLACSASVVGGVTYWYTIGSDLVTGIGVPAADMTTAFRVDGGNASTAFAFYNPSQTDTLQLTVQAYDASGKPVGSADLSVPPNGHTAFNAVDQIASLPADFSGSFNVPSNGQQFVPLALGVANTNANAAGYVLFTIPSLSGVISGIAQEQIRK